MTRGRRAVRDEIRAPLSSAVLYRRHGSTTILSSRPETGATVRLGGGAEVLPDGSPSEVVSSVYTGAPGSRGTHRHDDSGLTGTRSGEWWVGVWVRGNRTGPRPLTVGIRKPASRPPTWWNIRTLRQTTQGHDLSGPTRTDIRYVLSR